MGNARGFLDFKRMDFKKIAPKERVLNFKEFTIPLDKKEQNSRWTMYGLWGSLLSYGCDERRKRCGLSFKQSHS